MIDHTSWTVHEEGKILWHSERRTWMSKYDDSPPGTLTKDDLREALRVNSALLRSAQADIEYRDRRIARCRELIAEQEAQIVRHNEDADTAPQRIARIRTTLERQQLELGEMSTTQRSEARELSSAAKSERIAQLAARLATGDPTAAAELRRLL